MFYVFLHIETRIITAKHCHQFWAFKIARFLFPFTLFILIPLAFFCFLATTHARLTKLIRNNSIYSDFIYCYYLPDKRWKTWFLKTARTILWDRLSAHYIFQWKVFVVALSFRWKYRIWWLSSGVWVCKTTNLLYVTVLNDLRLLVEFNVLFVNPQLLRKRLSVVKREMAVKDS